MAQDSLSDFPAAEYRFETRRKNTIILNTTNSFDVFFFGYRIKHQATGGGQNFNKNIIKNFYEKKMPDQR